MKTSPILALFVFALRFIPGVRNLAWVSKTGTVDANISALEPAQVDKLSEVNRAGQVFGRTFNFLY